MKKIIEDLYKDDRKSNLKTIKSVRKHKGEINDLLLEELEKIFNNINVKEDFVLPEFVTYAILLLAEFKDTRAYPIIIKLISIPEHDTDTYLNDIIIDKLASIIASVYDGNINILNEVIENPNLDWYTRVSVLEFYTYLYQNNKISKEELITYLRKLIKLYNYEDVYIHNGIIDCIIDCHLFEMLKDIQKMFDEDSVDLNYRGGYDNIIDDIFTYKETDKKIAPLTNAEEIISNWYGFIENIDKTFNSSNTDKLVEDFMDFLEKEADNYNIDYKKVGRNDPCPCGSGKKYKKCCLNKVIDLLPYQKFINQSLAEYPKKNNNKDEIDFYTYFKPEYIEIDELLYKALKKKNIPIYIERNLMKEDKIDLKYLDEAYPKIKNIIEENTFKTMDEYDAVASIHFKLIDFFHKYCTLLLKMANIYDNYLDRTKEVLNYFYQNFIFNELEELDLLDIINFYCHITKNHKKIIEFCEEKLKTNKQCRYDFYDVLFDNYYHCYEYDELIKKIDKCIENEPDEELKELLIDLKFDYLDDEDFEYYDDEDYDDIAEAEYEEKEYI